MAMMRCEPTSRPACLLSCPPACLFASDTGMANIPGTNDVVICYDKNGHAWAPYPGDGDKSAVFTVRVTIERVVSYSAGYEHIIP